MASRQSRLRGREHSERRIRKGRSTRIGRGGRVRLRARRMLPIRRQGVTPPQFREVDLACRSRSRQGCRGGEARSGRAIAVSRVHPHVCQRAILTESPGPLARHREGCEASGVQRIAKPTVQGSVWLRRSVLPKQGSTLPTLSIRPKPEVSSDLRPAPPAHGSASTPVALRRPIGLKEVAVSTTPRRVESRPLRCRPALPGGWSV